MPVSYAREAGGRLVVVTATGVVGPGEYIRVLEEGIADTSLPDGAAILVDATAAEPAMTVDDLWRIARVAQRLHTRGVRRLAIAAASDLGYGLGRAFEVSAGAIGLQAATFRTLADARAWLAAD